MRADNNWEDKVGKRLYDFEGELSPQAWNNISKKIQPKRRNRWFIWLPLVLILLSVPAGLYYSGKLETILNSEEKPAGTIASSSNPESTVAINPAKPASESVAETAQKVMQPGENKDLNETQKAEKLIPKTDAVSSSKVKEQLASGSNIPSETKRPKKNAFVIIPGRETKKPASEKKNADTEKSEITRHVRKPSFNAATAFATRANKKNAGKSSGKIGITAEEKLARTYNSAAIENSNPVSLAKETGINSEVNSSGKNLASGKTINAKSATGNTKDPKEISGINNTQKVNNPETSEPKTEQISKPESGKNEGTILNPLVADSLISKTDSLAVKNISKADSTEKKLEKQKKQWAFSVYGTPHYTFQRVTPNENDDTRILRLNNKNDIESERLGYEFGLRAFYPVKEKLQLEFGLQFAHVTQHLNFTTASQFADSAMVYQQGNTVNMDVYNRELKQLYLIKYTLAGLYTGLNKSFDSNLSLNVGIGANWILSSKTVPASTQISNASFAPYLSAGLNYTWTLSPTLELQAGPNIQYYLKSLQKKDGLFCTEPTVFGFKVGILFRSKP